MKLYLLPNIITYTGVFENRVLRKIFAVKREEITVGWKELHNKRHYNL